MRTAMMAYIFWHRPLANVTRQAYEDALTSFHRDLGKRTGEGFLGSATYRISATPWLDERLGYEDWNFVESSASLDPLNRKAVASDMWDVHAGIASKTDVGYGGLYHHVAGEAGTQAWTRAAWLRRPRGVRFEALVQEIVRQAAGPVSIWRRQMALGPGYEFVVLGEPPLALDLPGGWESRYVDRTPLSAATATS